MKSGDTMLRGAQEIIQRLNARGFEAYLVGGCVRDKVLRRPVKDYDIATSARPEEVQGLFERTVPTGLQHGTVTVLINHTPYEVTTFRTETDYESHRRPAEVQFISSLNEDLARRDFTMNAMAMDLNGQLIDPFGGQADAASGLLRCVGEPSERFHEDALRMLRCIRFAAEYGLKAEQRTWEALMSQIGLLRHIAMERVYAELERMLSGRDAAEAVRMLASSKAFSYCKEDMLLARISENEDWTVLNRLPDADTRAAYLYIKLQLSPQQTAEDLRRLTCPRARIEEVKRAVSAHEALSAETHGLLMLPCEAMEEALHRVWVLAALEFGLPALHCLHKLYSVDPSLLPMPKEAGSSLLELLLHQGLPWLDRLPVTRAAELAVTGEDLKAWLSVKPGPVIGQLLRELTERTALGRLPNDRSRLAEEAAKLMKEIYKMEKESHE